MWEKGISAFVGLHHSLDALVSYLKLAKGYGYTRLFTSLHIPEANPSRLLSDFQTFINEANVLEYSITADISPQALSMLGGNLSKASSLKNLGLSALRLDYGFSPNQIAAFTHSSGLDVELNASTITPAILEQLFDAKADFTTIRACHNYYPRPETGLSFSLFAQRSKLLRDYGIPVLAFIPSFSCPRGPIFAGLPTLEKHRHLTPQLAAKELLASGLVDGLLFGDPLVAESELASVAALKATCIELQVIVEPDISAIERQILFAEHTNRTDPGECVIRSQEARNLCSSVVPPRKAGPRQVGAVTIDNENYLRYMGEMQIIQSLLPTNPRVNLVAQVIPEEVFLLSHIGPGKSFRLKEYTTHES